MDEKSLQILEFPKIREILANHTTFSAGRQLALELQPLTDPARIILLLKQSAEARYLLSVKSFLSLRDIHDVREIVALACRGVMLEPQQLADVRITLAVTREFREEMESVDSEIPALWDLGRDLVTLPGLEAAIEKCISPAAEVLASSTTRLTNIRFQAKEVRRRILGRLQGIIDSDPEQRFIQEPIITERDGRYVLLVKVDMRHEVKGIVHDFSGSGATVFMEPWSTVDLGNELRELLSEEKREVERILKELSRQVAEEGPYITENIRILADLDLALAKGRYAQAIRAVEPAIAVPDEDDATWTAASSLKLVQARHPLLKGKVVPLSLTIGGDYRGLVITGPNTGGKTVSLKTVGLLSLMAHAGMPIPASDGSSIPVFDAIFADIGDEQSIELTLSTFSWHMGNISRIIKRCTGRSLVLLDELGTSTDPGEGAALARAILLHILKKGSMIVATTHYGDLKVFAHTTPGLQNASLDFDPVTLLPTYHLTLGIPGGSNAIAIASQLGLPEDIIAAARELLAKGPQEVESLLADLMTEKQAMAAVRRDVEAERAEAAKLTRRLQLELEDLEGKRGHLLEETRDSLVQQAADLQRLIRSAEVDLKKARSREKVDQARKALDTLRRELASETWQPRKGAEPAKEFAPGDSVWLKDMRLWGTVLALADDGQADVQVGHSRVRLDLTDLQKFAPSGETPAPPAPASAKPRGGRFISSELDLRGKRADDVAPELDSYLNKAFLAELGQVRIVHGFGTGTVRQIVRDELASHPLVKSFRYGEKGEGGNGVTVVEL